MPCITPATVFPPFTRPCFSRHSHSLIFKSFSGITRHYIKSPRLFTCLSIVCSDIPSIRCRFRTSISYKYFTIKGFGCSGDTHLLRRVYSEHRPYFFTRFVIHGYQSSIPGSSKNFTVIVGDASALSPSRFSSLAYMFGYLRIILPYWFSIGSIYSTNSVHGAREV